MKDKFENIFKDLEGKFDLEEPTIGHFDRFQAKLTMTPKSANTKGNKFFYFIAIAASIVLFFGIWIGSTLTKPGMELAELSPEMKETQNYFVTVINQELKSIEIERNSETEHLIEDALLQLNKLETAYQLLTLELKKSTVEKRIIFAMISNFQQRVDVLQGLLTQIENFKQLKTQKNETHV